MAFLIYGTSKHESQVCLTWLQGTLDWKGFTESYCGSQVKFGLHLASSLEFSTDVLGCTTCIGHIGSSTSFHTKFWRQTHHLLPLVQLHVTRWSSHSLKLDSSSKPNPPTFLWTLHSLTINVSTDTNPPIYNFILNQNQNIKTLHSKTTKTKIMLTRSDVGHLRCCQDYGR